VTAVDARMLWPRVSVIVVNYNGRNYLQKCVSHILENSYADIEVIIVDNASTDGSMEQAKVNFGALSGISIRCMHRNVGFPAAVNEGIREATGEYVLLLNHDAFLEKSAIKELVRAMQDHACVPVAQAKLLTTDVPPRIEAIGLDVDTFGLARKIGSGQEDGPGYTCVRNIWAASGAAMMIKRRILDEVGLFDSKFFLYHEDVDFCWRVRLRGYKVLSVPTAAVRHVGGSATRRYRHLVVFHTTKNHIASCIKNLGSRRLLGLAAHLPFFLLAVIVHDVLVRKAGELLPSRFGALGWCVQNLRYLWTERLKVQRRIRLVDDRALFRDGRAWLASNIATWLRSGG